MKRLIITIILVISLSVTAFADIPSPERFRKPLPVPARPENFRPIPLPSRQGGITSAKFSLTPVKDQECAIELAVNISKDVDYVITFRDRDNKKVIDSVKGKSSEDSQVKHVIKYQRPEKNQELHYLLRAKCKETGKRERVYVKRITVYNVNDTIYFMTH